MYKRKSKALAPLSSQNRSTLTNSIVASTSSAALTSQNPLIVSSRIENVDPAVSPPKRMKPSQQVNDLQDEDMFDIPCSQNPTAPRFSSQRSIMARTQSILAIHRQPKNYFESVLMKCGVGLEADCYILTCNHLNFVTKVRNLLRSNENYPDNIREFIAGVVDAMKTYMALGKLFSGCKLSLPSSDSIYQSQESLIKDLLVIDFLQVQLIEILFEKIETFVGNDETLKLDTPYVDLILTELKFLNIVEHGDIVSLRVFQVFELATANYRQIIIRSIPDIIDVSRHDKAMERLMRLVPDDTNLLAFSNVDTFGNMQLSAHNLSELRNKIVNHMKYRQCYESFPSFVKFILRINKDETVETLPQILSNLRDCLRWNVTTENEKQVHANQKKVFDCIVRSLSASKQMYDSWLKIIQNISLDDQKSVDFIILLILMKVNEDKAYYIEQLIRKKIRQEQFSLAILDELVEDFMPILKEYLTLFISILDKLFRDKMDAIIAFATHGFKTLFDVEQFNKKVLLSKLVGYVCQNHIGSETATNALRLLSEFNENNPAEMQNNSLQLLRMLDRASELNLAQYRMVMNILCSIAYPLAPMSGSPDLQNHIDMLLKKQVASSMPTIKNLGIVGVVQTIDHLVWTKDTSQCGIHDERLTQSEETFVTIEDIKDASAKTAAQYLDLILSATRNSPESLGLCFDELAAVLSHRNKNHRKQLAVNKSFKIWISDFIVEHFQDLFVVDEMPALPVECEYQYSLNSAEDSDTYSEEIGRIGVNIAGLTFKPSSNPLGSILLLPSFFNLLRITQQYRYGNLITINALLGCAIILPKCMNSNSDMEFFSDHDEAIAKKILDLHYLTVNWMRETISAFVSQRGDNMLKKTMIRLNEVIKLEEKIRNLLELAPSNYTPPICQFNCSPVKKASTQIKAPTGKLKTSKRSKAAVPDPNTESINVTLLDILNTQTNAAGRFNAKARTKFCSLSYGPKEIYRQMDPDVARLLDQELLIKYPLPTDRVGEVLGLVEFKFLMDDLVIKMESIFGVKQSVPDQPMQYVLSPSDLFDDLINFLPRIVAFFNQLANHLHERISDSESENDAQLYTEELNYVKICIGLCLRLFAAVFTWPSFQLQAHKPLLKESLAKLAESSESEVDGQQVIDHFVNRHASTMWDLQSAVHMLHLTRALAVHSNSSTSNDTIVDLCRKFLSKRWYGYDGTPERGGKCNVLLDDLLKGMMKSATLSKIDELLKITARDAKDMNGKNACMKSFPNFYKANIALLYRSLCAALIHAVEEKLGKSAPTTVQLKIFEKSTIMLWMLGDSVGVINNPRSYGIFLKHAHSYIKIFLKNGIPLIKTGLRSNSDRIIDFLKSFNKMAAFIHKICCHWKANQNAAIMAQIPFVRETIETLLIKVKDVLASNNCASAFWQSNLKNKNLHDEEILTQSTDPDDDENEDDELPDDDDSLDDDSVTYDQELGSRETSVETTKRMSKANSDASSLLF